MSSQKEKEKFFKKKVESKYLINTIVYANKMIQC